MWKLKGSLVIMKKIILLLLLFSNLSVAQDVLDEIVAVVDNEIIMRSELDLRVAIESAQKNLDADDPNLRKNILESMVTEKLLYAQAELDSIVVGDEEIDQQLDYQMNYFIQQYGSRERVEETYGMSIERIKREFRDDTRKNLMAQRVQQQKFGSVEVTLREVELFYNTYKDSLGLIPEKFTLSHIFINPKQTEKVKNKAREFAQSLLDSIRNGADFAELAKENSDDPGSAAKGGDLGTVKRGVFYPEFESAAFALNPGGISEVTESPVGFHIIELISRKGDAIHTRHILIKIENDDDADISAIEMLTEIRDSVIEGFETFKFFARKYSDDKETAKFGGKLGTFELAQLDKKLLDQVYKLKVEEISFPKRLDIDANNYGFHIIRLDKRVPEHIANIDEDYDDIKRLAEYRKREKLFNDWVKELKSEIYWEYRI